MSDAQLEILASRAGLAVDWIDANGRAQKVAPAVLRNVLIGIRPHDLAANPGAPDDGLRLTGTVTAVSDYDFRGISLSAKDPALQGSIDWAAANGFYVGAWASNIDYGPGVDGDIEVDLYAGFAGEVVQGLQTFGHELGLEHQIARRITRQ